MGWLTTFLSTLTAILIFNNVCIGFDTRFHEELKDDLEKRQSDGQMARKAIKMPKWAKKYTRGTKGCPCWWDLTKGDVCACCKNKGIQCGYPKHRFCQRDAGRPQYRKGCPGSTCYNPYFSINSLLIQESFMKEQNYIIPKE